MTLSVTAKTRVAGVVGAPVRHSLSPRLHNAWLQASGLDGVYVAIPARADAFGDLVRGLRGGGVAGLNVTLPFKEAALAEADVASPLARAAGAANLLLFHDNGQIEARNTDGEGLIGAITARAPAFQPSQGPIVILGAGGAARGAAAALIEAGCPQVRVVNRTVSRAHELVRTIGPQVLALEQGDASAALDGAVALINATSLGLGGGPGPEVPWALAPAGLIAMDMIYKPLVTGFLAQAQAQGLLTVDGLDMLIRQAVPSFEAFFGQAPPAAVDARALLLTNLEPAA